jgi:hypothetical protein
MLPCSCVLILIKLVCIGRVGDVCISWRNLAVCLGNWKSLSRYGFYLSMAASLGRKDCLA